MLGQRPATLAQPIFYNNPYSAKLIIYLNFQSLEVVDRYRDPQPQVLENNSCFFYLRPQNLKILMFKHTFRFQYQ